MGDATMPAAAPPPSAAAAAQPARKTTKAAPGKVRGLADLGGDSDSDDSDGPREYYTGGEKRCAPPPACTTHTKEGFRSVRRGHAGQTPAWPSTAQTASSCRVT